MIIYNSALKGIGSNIKAKPCKEDKTDNYHLLTHDLFNPFPDVFNDCAFLYAETCWKHGFDEFNRKAKINDSRLFTDLCHKIADIIKQTQQPIYLTLGKEMLKKLPQPNGTAEIKQNGSMVILAWWHTEFSTNTRTTNELCQYFGTKYNSMGDFMCGYGQSLIDFLYGGGQKVVGSDYDSVAVGVTKQRLTSFF